MRISKIAQRNHDELFPNHKSTLKVTDPELIEVFDNFAFDEVLSYGNLDTKTRLMVILASLIAQQTLSEYRVMLGGALNVGVTPVEVKEIVYQSVPYTGIAKAFDFIHATNEMLESRGVKLPLESQSTTTPQTRYEKGLALQKSIFGKMIDKLYEESPKNQLHIQKYLSANCFGDYQTRKGLDIKTRELLTYSMLISMGGAESQVKGHIQGNVNVGNDKETLLSVTTQLLPYIGYPRTLNAIKCLNEVIPEKRSEKHEDKKCKSLRDRSG
jgi:4-carboxymuconolactone decarboxylase